MILANGGGMLDKASEDLDIIPSLRPVGTFQYGPPYSSTNADKSDCLL